MFENARPHACAHTYTSPSCGQDSSHSLFPPHEHSPLTPQSPSTAIKVQNPHTCPQHILLRTLPLPNDLDPWTEMPPLEHLLGERHTDHYCSVWLGGGQGAGSTSLVGLGFFGETFRGKDMYLGAAKLLPLCNKRNSSGVQDESSFFLDPAFLQPSS